MALPFIDGLNQVLRGMAPMNNAGGLLDPSETQATQQQGLLGLGAGLLGSAGPNRLPVSFGQALSSAAIQGNAMQNNAIDAALKRKLAFGELFNRMMPQQSADASTIIPVNTPQGVRFITKAQAASTPGVTPYQPPPQPREERPQQQLITRPAPDAGEGMVQDYTADLTNNKLVPIGKPYVPNGQQAGLGSREGVMFNRVAASGNEAAQALKNISDLPVGASTGYFGVGASPGTSALAAVKGVLTNKIAPQAVQDYNTMMAGVSRSLATIETAGLAPNGSLTHSMDSVQLREGDTEMTKLRKLAEMRQILEKGLEVNLENPRLPPEQKDLVRKIIAQAEDAIPYTHSDLTALEKAQEKNPSMTLQQLITQKGLRQQSTFGSESDAEAAAKAGTIKSGDRIVVNGVSGVWQ